MKKLIEGLIDGFHESKYGLPIIVYFNDQNVGNF